MAAFIPGAVKAFSLFFMGIGTLATTKGHGILGDSTVFTPKTQATALADSQLRYSGCLSIAVGAVGWWISNDVYARQAPLAFFGAGVVAGGLGRAVAAAKHGFGPGMRLAMWVELVIPVVFYAFGRGVGEW